MPLPDGRGDTKNIVCPFWTLTLFNEWHSSSTSKKIKAVFEVNAKAGKYLGSKVPYGYNRGDDQNHLPIINPETAPVVKRIFDMRVQGMSPLKNMFCPECGADTKPCGVLLSAKGRGRSAE